MPTHHLTPKKQQEEKEKEPLCLFAQTNYRNQMRRFGIKLDDRRRHMYVVGKTGMGKTTLMENMVLHDIYNGHGVGVVDPHGDFAEKIINYIPSNRINDVVYINPADVDFPVGFNILEVQNEGQKHLIAAGLMAVFKKIWPDVWSSRMEYILNNTLLALLDYPGSTLLGINRLLGDAKFRKKVVRALEDPVIKSFWQNEFANYSDKYRTEAVAPIQNKIGQFLSASIIRNMVAQVKSTIDIRGAMDSGKILIMNLSKGRIGEDNSRLLGGMLINRIQLAAMERVDTPEHERRDFFLYVDEFQNFATPSFANILSEARKYRLGLIMAHQYIAQLDEIVADAVFGNVGTLLAFRVGGSDAEFLTKEFSPTFTEEDIVNLAKYEIFLKLMIDGVASQPFSASTMPPIGSPTGSASRVIGVSRERYAKSRAGIEDKILRWSGLEGVDNIDTTEEKKPERKREDRPRDSKPKTERKVESKPKDRTGEQKPREDKPRISSQSSSSSSTEKKVEEPKKKEETEKKPEKKVLVEPKQEKKEDVLSLDSLLPKEKKVEEIRKEISFDSDDSVKEKKIEVTATPDNSRNEEVKPENPEGEPKKKKRRRRKRKKRGSGENQPSSEPSQQGSEPKRSENSGPKPVSPNQVITFDQ
jgi:hypothetical protein